MRIGDLIARRAVASPQRVCWEEHGHRRTFAELHRAANRVARALAAEGLAPGAHVAICADNRFEYLCVQFGVARAGLVLAHLSARFTAAELAALAGHADARVLFFGTGQTAAVEGARERLPAVQRCVRLPTEPSGTGPSKAEELPSWAVDLEAWLAPHEADDLPAGTAEHIDPAAPFQLLYTSGTTGAPKGALISHRAKIAQGTTHALNLGLVPGDRILSALPLYHQYAQWLVGVSAPIAGATVVSQRGFDAEDCWAALAGQAITHLPLVPTTLYRLLDAAGGRPHAAPHLRCIVYGGAPIDPARIPQVRATFPGVRLFQGFGQTEAGYCLGLMDEDHETHAHSLGRPDLFSRVRLLDERGREVAAGETGEIVVRTPYLMNGYYKDPTATAAYFADGPDWGRTGDLATRDADGFYTLVGRKRELIIRGGVNVYPAEVEQVLRTHPAVADAAVYGVPDAHWGEQVAAAVIPRPGQHLEEAGLDAHCRAVLAAFKCPAAYRIVEHFPRTASGKVQKFALRTVPARG